MVNGLAYGEPVSARASPLLWPQRMHVFIAWLHKFLLLAAISAHLKPATPKNGKHSTINTPQKKKPLKPVIHPPRSPSSLIKKQGLPSSSCLRQRLFSPACPPGKIKSRSFH